jgi:chemotaxis response regulator CheB
MGVAIVIVNHMRTLATHLHEVLPRFTSMPVNLITERLVIQPNQVFIIPANRDLHVLDGEFRLEPISKPSGWPERKETGHCCRGAQTRRAAASALGERKVVSAVLRTTGSIGGDTSLKRQTTLDEG